MRCPIWVPMLFPTSSVACTSVTGGATCWGAPHRHHPPPTLVGCPVAGRTRVYIHSALLRRGCARTANSAFGAARAAAKQTGSPASVPHDVPRKVADLIPEKKHRGCSTSGEFFKCRDTPLRRGMLSDFTTQASGGVLNAPDSKLLPPKAVGCTLSRYIYSWGIHLASKTRERTQELIWANQL